MDEGKTICCTLIRISTRGGRLCSACGKREASEILPRTCDCKSIDLLCGALDVAVICEANADGAIGTTRIVPHAALTLMCTELNARPRLRAALVLCFLACAIMKQLTKRNMSCLVELYNIHTHRQNAKQKSKQFLYNGF
jgi:hypothetical protein